MIVSVQTMDNWFAKGFDTLCAYVENRTKEDRAINPCYADDIQRAIDKIDVIIKYDRLVSEENSDQMIFLSLVTLTDLLTKRYTATNMRELGPQVKEKLIECQERLLRALKRIRENG